MLKELILQTSQQGWTLATGTEKPLPVGTISGVQPCFVPNSQPESYAHSPGPYTLINYQQRLNSKAPVCAPTASLLMGLVLRQLQDKSQQLTDPTESLVVQQKSYFLSHLRPKRLNQGHAKETLRHVNQDAAGKEKGGSSSPVIDPFNW